MREAFSSYFVRSRTRYDPQFVRTVILFQLLIIFEKKDIYINIFPYVDESRILFYYLIPVSIEANRISNRNLICRKIACVIVACTKR